jgi:putative addiction module component (TIGR02574 family)
MSTIDISSMDIQQRLEIMEALWNSFLSQESALESPQWHQAVIAERINKIHSGKAEFIPVNRLKAKPAK